MKLIKAMMLAAALALSTTAYAITDDDSITYSTALQEGNVAYVTKMLDSGEVGVDEKRAFFGWTALQIAANKGQLEVIKVLVAHKAKLDYQHEMTKNTALHLAAINNHKDVVQYLLSVGSNPNLKMKGGVSILRVIRDMGNTEMADLLVKGGAVDDGCQGECF